MGRVFQRGLVGWIMINPAVENAMYGILKVHLSDPLAPALNGSNGRHYTKREGLKERTVPMKIAEALMKKADLVKKIAQVKEQLFDNLVVPEIKLDILYDSNVKTPEILEIERKIEDINNQLEEKMLNFPPAQIIEMGLKEDYQTIAVPLRRQREALQAQLKEKLASLAAVKTTAALFAEYENLNVSLKELIAKISRANALGGSDGVLLSELLAERQWLVTKLSTYQSLFAQAKEDYFGRVDRYGSRVVKEGIRTVDLGALDKTIDGLCQQLRVLDVKIQKLNWEIDIDE